MSGLDITRVYGSVTYGNDRFICVGSSNTSSYYSTNGKSWTAMSGLSGQFNSITYGNDRFVCVGYSGSSYYYTNTKEVEVKTYSVEHHTTPTERKMSEVIAELHNKSVILKTTLLAGETTITISHVSITENSILSFHSPAHINPTEVVVNNGSVTLTYNAQETDVEVGVRVDG